MRVGASGERAQAPKSGTGPYEGPVALAYGPQPKQPVSPKDKHKIVRYFIMSGLESSPQSPAFYSSIYAWKSVRLRTLQGFWRWLEAGREE
jgi:hypothetical protein